MNADILYALGAVSVAALLASAAYLWRLLGDIPVSRRLVNMLMPASQIGLVACAFALRPFFSHWDVMAAVVVPVGIVGAILNPLFFKGLLDAERAETEAERVAFLEDQVATQEQYAALAKRRRAAAARVRNGLDAQLARVEEALAAGDSAAACARVADAERMMRAPRDRRCQHPVVDALLAAKAAWCARERIRIKMDATVPDDLSTPDVELCALFANALDNAVHACFEVPEDGRWIRVKAHPAHGHFLLEVENSCATEGDDVAVRGGKAPRRAHDGLLSRHGHGLSIMREIVERHDGELVCQQEGGTFRLSAIWRLET